MSDPRYYLEMHDPMMPAHEREFLKDTAELMVTRFGGATVIVNIGVARGASLHSLRAGAPDALLIGVDVNYERYPLIGDPRACLIRGRSQDVCVARPVHLVFVDGSHSYGPVKGDIVNWASKIPMGGLISFHDLAQVRSSRRPYRPCRLEPGVVKAVAEWKRSSGWASCWKEHKPGGRIVNFERRGYVGSGLSLGA